jgi:hypothetical protein
MIIPAVTIAFRMLVAFIVAPWSPLEENAVHLLTKYRSMIQAPRSMSEPLNLDYSPVAISAIAGRPPKALNIASDLGQHSVRSVYPPWPKPLALGQKGGRAEVPVPPLSTEPMNIYGHEIAC